MIALFSEQYFPEFIKSRENNIRLDLERRSNTTKTIDTEMVTYNDYGFTWGDQVIMIELPMQNKKQIETLENLIRLFPYVFLSCKYGLFRVLMKYKQANNSLTLTCNVINKANI